MATTKKTVSVNLYEDQLKNLKSTNLTTGDALDKVLAAYETTEAVIEAVVRHLKNPIQRDRKVFRTSVYMNPIRSARLREAAAKTELQFDGLVRIFVDDYCAKNSNPTPQFDNNQTTTHNESINNN